MDTDLHWNQFAEEDPYHAVVTAPEYHRKMTSEARRRFFDDGENTVARALAVLEKFFDAPKQFGVALDFGCGVGRLLLPLARRARFAIGVDVAEAMRSECRRNAAASGLDNIELLPSDDTLSKLAGRRREIDLALSLIVFQHIPPERGISVLRAILDLLRPGGFAILHFLVANAIRHLPGEVAMTTGQRFHFYQRMGNAALVRLDGSPDATRLMQMNHYNLNELTCILQARGVTEFLVRSTDHGGAIGTELYLRMPRG